MMKLIHIFLFLAAVQLGCASRASSDASGASEMAQGEEEKNECAVAGGADEDETSATGAGQSGSASGDANHKGDACAGASAEFWQRLAQELNDDRKESNELSAARWAQLLDDLDQQHARQLEQEEEFWKRLLVLFRNNEGGYTGPPLEFWEELIRKINERDVSWVGPPEEFWDRLAVELSRIDGGTPGGPRGVNWATVLLSGLVAGVLAAFATTWAAIFTNSGADARLVKKLAIAIQDAKDRKAEAKARHEENKKFRRAIEILRTEGFQKGREKFLRTVDGVTFDFRKSTKDQKSDLPLVADATQQINALSEMRTDLNYHYEYGDQNGFLRQRIAAVLLSQVLEPKIFWMVFDAEVGNHPEELLEYLSKEAPGWSIADEARSRLKKLRDESNSQMEP